MYQTLFVHTTTPYCRVCIFKCFALWSQYQLALHSVMLKMLKVGTGTGKLWLSAYSYDVCPASDLDNGGYVQQSGKGSCLGQYVRSPHSLSAFRPLTRLHNFSTVQHGSLHACFLRYACYCFQYRPMFAKYWNMPMEFCAFWPCQKWCGTVMKGLLITDNTPPSTPQKEKEESENWSL
jgi:hypothetical protein